MIRKYCFLIILLLSSTLKGQSVDEIYDAQVLSDGGQYLLSIGVLEAFISANPNRFYDLSLAYFLESYDYLQLGDLEAAIAANQSSIDLRDQLRSEDLAENYQRMGVIYTEMEDLPKAMDYLMDAAELPTDDPMLSSEINISIAKVFLQLKDYQKALDYYQSALDIMSIELDENHIHIAKTDFEIGMIYRELDDRASAQKWFSKSLKIALGTFHNFQLAGKAYGALGATEANDEKAIWYFRQAMDVYRRSIGEFHPAVAKVYLEWGRRDVANGDWKTAKRHLNRCIEILGHPECFLKVGEGILVKAWSLLARVDLLEEEENETSLLEALSKCEAARGYFYESYDLLRTPREKLDFVTRTSDMCNWGTYAAARLYQLTGEDSYLHEAFRFAELTRMKIRQAMIPKTIEEDPLVNRDRQYVRRILESIAILSVNHKKVSVQKQLRQLQEEYRQFQMNAAVNHTAFFSKHYQKGTIEVPDVQRQLAADEALLIYHCGESHIVGIALTKDEESLFISPVGNLAQKAPDFLMAIKENKTKQIGKIGSDLFQTLVAPFSGILSKKKSLLIIPGKYLSGIPFEVFIQQKPRRYTARKYDYLIRDFAVSYTTSATVFFDKKNAQHAEKDLLLAGADFKADEQAYIDFRTAWLFDTTLRINPELVAISSDGERINANPVALLPVFEIADMATSKKSEVSLLLDELATETNLKKIAGNFQNIYLSTYTFTTLSPALSGVVFTTDYSKEDGVLFSSEIRRLGLQADLLTIGYYVGSPADGLNPFYLANDFITGGAKEVVVPLWKCQWELDPFLDLYYDRLLKGEQPINSIQRAKKKLLKNKAYSPRDWGGYLLVR